MAAPAVENRIYTAIGLDFETGGLDPVRCACTQIALEAIRLDTLEVFDRYAAYIAQYCKQELGAARRKVLRSKHELAQPTGWTTSRERLNIRASRWSVSKRRASI
mgnify:CR=1 FL=1